VTADILALAASSNPEGVAWRNLDDDAEMTLGQWNDAADRLARGLSRRGVDSGDRVVIQIGPGDPFPWLVTYVGVHRARATAVPINTRLAPPELSAVIRHAEAALVVEAGAGPQAAEGPGPDRVVWNVLLDDDPSPLPGAAAAHAADTPDPVDLMYTSGTTGAPKAVVARAGVGAAPGAPPERPARWNGLGFLTCSPFATTSGILLVDGPLRSGMSGWYLPRFDAGRWLELVERHRPIVAFLVPAMAQLLVAHPRFVDADLSSLAALTFGGAPMARATLLRLTERLPGAEVLVGYGLTEFGAVSRTPSGDAGRHLGSVGRPLEGVEVRVIGSDGAEAGPSLVGEVTVRGSWPARRYYKDAEATEQTWRDGWLHTGDLGYHDADGFLWITGRAKDVIIRGGHNIAPRDVEEVLLSHPDVVDAVVVGVPHGVLGEDVATWVVLREGSVATDSDLRSFMLERLADYKVPRAVHMVDELPRNASGKVVRADLPGLAPTP
jgi:long-chain acyl-CoA synthetase